MIAAVSNFNSISKKLKIFTKLGVAFAFSAVIAACGDDDNNNALTKPADKAKEVAAPIPSTDKGAAVEASEKRIGEIDKQIGELTAAFKDENNEVHKVVDEQINLLRQKRDVVNAKLDALKQAANDNFSEQRSAIDASLQEVAKVLEPLLNKSTGVKAAQDKKSSIDQTLKAYDESSAPKADDANGKALAARRAAEKKAWQDKVPQIDQQIAALKVAPIEKAIELNVALQQELDAMKAQIVDSTSREKAENEVHERVIKIDASIESVKKSLADATNPEEKAALQVRLSRSTEQRANLENLLKDFWAAKNPEVEAKKKVIDANLDQLEKTVRGE